MEASLLGQFEQQYSVQTAEITAKIAKLQLVDEVDRQTVTSEIYRMMVDVDDLLEQMELSVRELPTGGPDRHKYENRVKSYRVDKEQLRKEFQNTVQRLRNAQGTHLRDELMAAGTSDGFLAEENRSRLISNTERLDRSSRKLEESHRVCIETEKIGADVLNNLENQRSTIDRSRQRLRDAEQELGQSSKVLSRMIYRAIQNRVALLLVAGGLLFTFSLFIYFKAT